jgi:hypothetical protein
MTSDPAWWAESDQIDASLRETKAMIARWDSEPSAGQLIVKAIRDLRAAVAALEQRVAKLEEPEADRLRDLVAFLRALAPSVPVGEALRQWDEQQEAVT